MCRRYFAEARPETADPLQSGLRADLSPDQKHALERLEPIRWPNTTLNDDDRPSLDMAAAPTPAMPAATPQEPLDVVDEPLQDEVAPEPVAEAPVADEAVEPPFAADEDMQEGQQ